MQAPGMLREGQYIGKIRSATYYESPQKHTQGIAFEFNLVSRIAPDGSKEEASGFARTKSWFTERARRITDRELAMLGWNGDKDNPRFTEPYAILSLRYRASRHGREFMDWRIKTGDIGPATRNALDRHRSDLPTIPTTGQENVSEACSAMSNASVGV